MAHLTAVSGPLAAGPALSPVLSDGGQTGRWVVASAVLAVLLPNLLRVHADPDLWGHLLFGMTAIQQGELARIDPYSYTAAGQPWTNHEWLTEWMFGIVYAAAGPAGLVLLRGVLLLITTACLGAIAVRRRVPAWAVIAWAAFALPVMAQLYRVRPQMFTYMLMAATLLLCDLHRPGRRWTLGCFPLLMAVWVNWHAGFVAGLGIFGIHWAGFLLAAARLPDRRREWTYLGLVLAACVAATVCNPYGIGYWRFVFYAVTLPRPAITEWQSIFRQNGTVVLCYALAVLVPAFCWFLSRRRAAWAETVAFAIGVLLAGRHARHLPFLLMFGTVVLWRRLPEVLELHGRRLLETGRAARAWEFLAGSLLVLAVLIAGLGKTVREARAIPQEGVLVVSPSDYPIQAVEFLISHGIDGRLDCGFTWGEYCIYKLFPNSQVYCDGRYETVYPRRVSELALYGGNDPEVLRERLDGHGTEIVLARVGDRFGEWVAERADFVEVYSDPTARIFLRRIERFEPIIRARTEGRLRPPTHPGRPQSFPA